MMILTMVLMIYDGYAGGVMQVSSDQKYSKVKEASILPSNVPYSAISRKNGLNLYVL